MLGHIGSFALSMVLALTGAGGPWISGRAAPERLAWSDSFSGPSGAAPNPLIWTAEIGGGGWGNHEEESYTNRAANVALDGQGHLVITARRETYTGPDQITKPWTSARIITQDKRSFLYGRLVVRMKVPSGAGIWPAAWTLGTNIRTVGWPACGELDVLEAINDAGIAYQTAHGARAGARDWLDGSLTPSTTLTTAFHDYAVDWSPGKAVFSIDGKATRVVTPASMPPGAVWPFTGPQYVLLDLAVGGDFPGPSSASTPAVSRLLVDYVRVYRPR